MIRFSSRAKAFALLVAVCVGCSAQSVMPNSAQHHSALPDSSDSQGSKQPRRLTLESATDLLIANNLAVAAARFNVDILRAQRIAAGLRPHPNLIFSATQFTIPRVLNHPSEFIKTNEENGAANSSYTLEVDQLIERGNKRELRISQADLNTQVAEAQVTDALRQQLFQL